MMSFQNPFWPGMQGMADLPQQIEALIKSLTGFLEDKLPKEQMASMNSLTPPVEQLQPIMNDLMVAHQQLWQQMLQRKADASAEPVVAGVAKDRRFSSEAWSTSPVHDYMRQAYVLNSRFLNELAEIVPSEDAKGAARIRFLTSQFVDAMSPSNFAATNPDVIQKALADRKSTRLNS